MPDSDGICYSKLTEDQFAGVVKPVNGSHGRFIADPEMIYGGDE